MTFLFIINVKNFIPKNIHTRKTITNWFFTICVVSAMLLTVSDFALRAEESKAKKTNPFAWTKSDKSETPLTKFWAKVKSGFDSIDKSDIKPKNPPAKTSNVSSESGISGSSSGNSPAKSTNPIYVPSNAPSSSRYTKPAEITKISEAHIPNAPLPFENGIVSKTIDSPNNQAETTNIESVEKKNNDGTKVASLGSYSFDSRDWVEFFPIEHVSESISEDKRVSREILDTKPAEKSQTSDESRNLWDGAATPIATVTGIKPTSARTEFAAEIIEMPANIDLSPSYSKQLPYSEICGVVVVQSNFPLNQIAAILEEIKLLQRDLHLYMSVPAPKEKIELCLFKDEDSYIKFLQEVFPKAPRDRRALYIKVDNKPGTLLVQKTDDFEIDLRHEMTHAIIHASIRYVPIWLDEGLAKYFEVPVDERADANPYMKSVRWNVKFGAVPMLSRLEKLEDISEMGGREYRDSWSWVHFLIHHSPQSHRLLAGYLQMLASLSEANSARIPPISLYFDDVLENPRETYREHFREHF